MKIVSLITLLIFVILSCSQKKEEPEKVVKTDYQKKRINDSIFKSKLLSKYEDIIDLDNNKLIKFSYDYQIDNNVKQYLLSPELIDIYISDSSIYAKYFQSSYPNDLVFILEIDTNKINLENIKGNSTPKYLVANAKYEKRIDLIIQSAGEDIGSNNISIETELETSGTVILIGELLEIINEEKDE